MPTHDVLLRGERAKLELTHADGTFRVRHLKRKVADNAYPWREHAAAEARNLTDAICGALNVSAPTSRVLEIVAYVRSTTWGERLP